MGMNDDRRIDAENEVNGFKEITVTLYRFNKLSKRAQEKALEWMRECEGEDRFWSESVIEEWKPKLEALGFANPEILYSGFWSQGDGACFTCDIEIEKYIRAHKLGNKFRLLFQEAKDGNVGGKIKHAWRYFFATSTTVELEYILSSYRNYKTDRVEAQLDELQAMIEKERETLGNEIYKALEESYEWQTDDEHCKETIEANDYWFNEAGEVVSA